MKILLSGISLLLVISMIFFFASCDEEVPCVPGSPLTGFQPVTHLGRGTSGVIFPAEENHEKSIIIDEDNNAWIMKATLAVSLKKIVQAATEEEYPQVVFFYTLTGPQNAYEEYSSCDKMRLVISFDGTTARTEDIRYSQKQYHDRTTLMEIYDKEKSTLRYFTVHPNYLTTQQELHFLQASI